MAESDQPESMSPLGRLLKASMDERGLSTRDVEAAGGPPASTIGRLINPRVRLKRPPSDSTLQALARVLRIPEVRLQQAMAETMAWDITDPLRSEQIRTVAAAMARLDEHQQTTVQKIVLLIIDELTIAEWDTPPFPTGSLAVGTTLTAVGDIDIVATHPDADALPQAARKGTPRRIRERQIESDEPS